MRSVSHMLLLASITFATIGCTSKTDPTGSSPTAGAGIPEGDYELVGMELWGEPMPEEEVKKMSDAEKKVKITKDTITAVLIGEKPVDLKYTIDPSKTPAEINITGPSKGKKDETSHGIYKVEGDKVTIFLMGSKDPKNRPKEFKTAKPSKENMDADQGAMIVTVKKK